jgi:hypothetical protein
MMRIGGNMKVLITVKAEVEVGNDIKLPLDVYQRKYDEVKEAIIDHLIDDDYDVEEVK